MMAILPAAGLGTRMLSVTGGAAKEALPLGEKTILSLVLEEAFAAGASECIVVSSLRKPELNALIPGFNRVQLAFQDEPLGLAHAIASAGYEGDALVLLPDTVFAGGCAACRLAGFGDGALLTEMVGDEAVSSYGIVEADGGMAISRLLEKPALGETESRMAIAARYFFTGRLLAFIRAQVQSGERELTGIMQKAIDDGFGLRAVPASGLTRLDCGSPEGYQMARGVLG